jgi:hypothetical protein
MCDLPGDPNRPELWRKVLEESRLIFRAGGGLVLSEEMVVMDEFVRKKERPTVRLGVPLTRHGG